MKTEGDPIFSDEEVASWIETERSDFSYNQICMLLYGDDGTAKTGAAMDAAARFAPKDKKIIVIDFDGSAKPVKAAFHADDDRIKIIDPTTLTADGKIDYVNSYWKALAVLRFLLNNEGDPKWVVGAIIIDGIDTMKKWCEFVMKEMDLKMDPLAQVKDSWQWSRRNDKYFTILLLAKRLNCMKFYTCHLKEKKEWKSSEPGKKHLAVVEVVPDWVDGTPAHMFQKIFLSRGDVEDKTFLCASVEKSKGKLELEGARINVAEIVRGTEASATWYGINAWMEQWLNMPIPKYVGE